LPPDLTRWRTQAKAYLGAATRRSGKQGKFLIFAQGRTGSSLLVDVLNTSSVVRCEREILSKRVLWPRLFVEGRAAAHRPAVYGFKVKIYQLTEAQGIRDPGEWLRSMDQAGWRLIYLRRSNLLRHALSSFAAERNEGYQFVGATRPPKEPLHIDIGLLLDRLGFRKDMLRAESDALRGLEYETVVYEDDLMDSDSQQATLNRLSGYLRVPAADVAIERHRINVGELRSLVANFEEMQQALLGTEWAVYLR
jgi:hypothetical protein